MSYQAEKSGSEEAGGQWKRGCYGKVERHELTWRKLSVKLGQVSTAPQGRGRKMGEDFFPFAQNLPQGQPKAPAGSEGKRLQREVKGHEPRHPF